MNSVLEGIYTLSRKITEFRQSENIILFFSVRIKVKVSVKVRV